MAFDPRGWRKLVIDERVFYWQTVASAWGFHVRPELEPHRVLWVAHAVCGQGVGFYTTATPGVVRWAVECALPLGWPDARPHLQLITSVDPGRFYGPHLKWITPAAVALAQGIYADAAFDRMPILADALEEAGCDDADVLNHLRGEGPHHRGCWVIELLRGNG